NIISININHNETVVDEQYFKQWEEIYGFTLDKKSIEIHKLLAEENSKTNINSLNNSLDLMIIDNKSLLHESVIVFNEASTELSSILSSFIVYNTWRNPLINS